MPEKNSATARYIKGGFILLKSQILASITSFVIYLVAFLFLTKNNSFGLALYSICSMIATFLFIYSDAFKIAKDDLKASHNYEHYPLKGAVLEIVPALITTIIIVVWQLIYIPSFHALALQNSMANIVFLIIQTVFVGFTFPFRGFMQMNQNHISLISYFLIYLVPLLSSIGGYFAGTRDFYLYNKFIHPLIYKKKK